MSDENKIDYSIVPGGESNFRSPQAIKDACRKWPKEMKIIADQLKVEADAYIEELRRGGFVTIGAGPTYKAPQ